MACLNKKTWHKEYYKITAATETQNIQKPTMAVNVSLHSTSALIDQSC